MQQPSIRPSIASYSIENALDRSQDGAVEVVLELADGRRRWCFFFTPERLSLVGDWIEGTRVRMHLGVNHLVVVAELSVDIIDRVLRELESTGLLLERHSTGRRRYGVITRDIGPGLPIGYRSSNAMGHGLVQLNRSIPSPTACRQVLWTIRRSSSGSPCVVESGCRNALAARNSDRIYCGAGC